MLLHACARIFRLRLTSLLRANCRYVTSRAAGPLCVITLPAIKPTCLFTFQAVFPGRIVFNKV